ncbi:MAG: protocatechuate dioxygenase [Actinophytocola sp.]|nr:protocatechuate dioxygenase [Actinophytocola sp.]
MTDGPRRRTVLAAMGWGAVTLGVNACTGDEASEVSGGHAKSETVGRQACVLTPEDTEGPYYLDLDLVRSDITEGKPGVPLTLRATVVDAESCVPVEKAALDIWHADADGVYSGFEAGSGERFLRGVQLTDASGIAEFSTIVPGWYASRTTHIHAKVYVGDDVVHTGQLYFADSVIDAVADVEPYARRRGQRTTNDDDFLFPGGSASTLTVTGSPGAGYEAVITLGVRR